MKIEKNKENFAKLPKFSNEKFETAKYCSLGGCKFYKWDYSNFSKEIFILFNKQQVRYFAKKFSRENMQKFEIIAFDGIVSYNLKNLGIEHLPLDNFISINKRKNILMKSTRILVKKYNYFLKYLIKHYDKMHVDFFECIKFHLALDLLMVDYYNLYFCEMIKIINPSKIYFFSEETLMNKVLLKHLTIKKIDYEVHQLPLIYKMRDYTNQSLPFVTKEKNYILGIANKFFKIEKKDKIKKNIFPKLNNKKMVLCSPVDNQSNIHDALNFLTELKHKEKIIVIPLIFSLSSKNMDKLNGFMRVKFNIRSKNGKEEIMQKYFAFEKEFYDNFVYSQGSENLSMHLKKMINLKRYFCYYEEIKSNYDYLFKCINPELYFCYNELGFFSRIGLVVSKENKVKSIGMTQIKDEFFSYSLLEFIGKNRKLLNKYLPDEEIVFDNETKKKISRLTLIEDKNFKQIIKVNNFNNTPESKEGNNIKETKKKFLKELAVPADSVLILMTTQQHPFTFDYIKILTKVVEQISNESKKNNIVLIIKTHPLEFSSLYKIINHGKNKNIKIRDDINIYEAIKASDIIITSHSFTAVEAIKMGKRVILLSLSRRAFEPDIFIFRPNIFNNSLVNEVFNAYELKNKINEIIKLKNENRYTL